MLLDAVGCCWVLLDVVRCCWMLLDVVGCCWMLLDVVACCRMLLDVVSNASHYRHLSGHHSVKFVKCQASSIAFSDHPMHKK